MIGQLQQWFLPQTSVYSWLWEHRKPLVTTVLAGVFISKLLTWRRRYILRCKREEKQKACQQAIDLLSEHVQQNGTTDEQMNEICKLSLQQLTSKLQKGELKAIDVLQAYQKKALIVNKKTNAILDVVREAEATALECDQLEDRSNRPLHGVPISIKDSFTMVGYDSVLGVTRNINKPCSKDSVLIKVLKKQGAVPFVRTNVPQACMSYDTSSPMFGQTYNPHGEGRSPGGSSGGEGALIGGGGSPLGLGTDIGGSIRIPASMCGICGFKPTAGRCSSRDVNVLLQRQTIIPSVSGPMARDVDSLVLMMRAVQCQYHFDLDNTVPPMPFNEEVFKQTNRLRIGFYCDDEFMTAVPSMHRAVNIAVTALQDQGHEVIPWRFPDLGHRGMYFLSYILMADRAEKVLNVLKDDPSDHSVSNIRWLLQMNKTMLKAIILVTKYLQERIGYTLPALLGLNSVTEWHTIVQGVQKFRQEVEEDLKEKGIEILLVPGFTMPAPPLGFHQNVTAALSYTAVMNVLNFPAGTLPVTTVTAEDIANMANYPMLDMIAKTIKKSMDGAEGLPVGVQVIGLPWQEETTLRIMKELETALQQ